MSNDNELNDKIASLSKYNNSKPFTYSYIQQIKSLMCCAKWWSRKKQLHHNSKVVEKYKLFKIGEQKLEEELDIITLITMQRYFKTLLKGLLDEDQMLLM